MSEFSPTDNKSNNREEEAKDFKVTLVPTSSDENVNNNHDNNDEGVTTEVAVRGICVRTYDWKLTLENWRNHTGDVVSEPILVVGRRFKASLGFSNQHIAMWVGLIDRLGTGEKAEYTITLLAKDAVDHVIATSEESWTADHLPPKWKGVHRACSHDQLFKNNRFPDILCVRVCIKLKLREQVHIEPRFRIPVHCMTDPLGLGADLQQLMIRSDHSDLVLIVDDEPLPVHRCILSARSPVFHAMFTNNMAEKDEAVIVIPNMKPCTMRLLLQYVYSDRLSLLSYPICEKHQVSCEGALDLVSAADRFGLSKLAEVAFAVAVSKLHPCCIRPALNTALLHPHYRGSSSLINAIGFLCLCQTQAVLNS